MTGSVSILAQMLHAPYTRPALPPLLQTVKSISLTIWNVSHGLAVTVRTPTGRIVVYDAGRSESFSPLATLATAAGLRSVDCFVLSHPHADHLRDVDALVALTPTMLWRRHVAERRIREAAAPGLEEGVVDRYEIALDRRYTAPIVFGPENPLWGGCELRLFTPPDHPNLNNTSLVLFVGFENGYVCLPGDLERDGWLGLLGQPDFIRCLARTRILVAPHHGRLAGVCREAFALMQPQLCIISDGPSGDTSCSHIYSQLASGAWVTRRCTQQVIRRRALSTRKDGHIGLAFSPTEWTATIP